MTTTITTKAIASGGLAMVLSFCVNDTEFIPLLLSGLFASFTSYFYDWVHRDPRKLGLKELSELIKYMLYGVSMMFIIYYIGKEHGNRYISLPLTSWGFIAAICAGSAVTIVGFVANILKKYIARRVEK